MIFKFIFISNRFLNYLSFQHLICHFEVVNTKLTQKLKIDIVNFLMKKKFVETNFRFTIGFLVGCNYLPKINNPKKGYINSDVV